MLVLIAAEFQDTVHTCSVLTPSQMQGVLMASFFQDVQAKFLQDLSHGSTHSDVCGADSGLQWKGVSCKQGRVQKVHLPYSPYGNFRVHYLPGYVHSVNLAECDQSYSLDSRQLPQTLEYLQMCSNRIHGTIDLTNLPESSVNILLHQNYITGPITLTRLPQSLHSLDLSRNRIHQNTVYYSHIPKSVFRICLQRGDDSNRIDAVVAIGGGDELDDGRILAEITK